MIFRSLPSIVLLSALALVGLSSCENLGIGTQGGGGNGVIQGTVTTRSGQPVVGAMVVSGTDTSFSDIRGNYKLRKATITDDRASVTVTKEGYFSTGTQVGAASSTGVPANVVMIERVLIGQIDNSVGGRLGTEDGAALTFPANAFRRADGSAFTGQVKVYAATIDPMSPNFSQEMPGGLIARDPNNPSQVGVLESAGALMLEAEPLGLRSLKNSGGELALNQPVQVCVTVHPDLLAQLPALSQLMVWNRNPVTNSWNVASSTPTVNGNVICYETEELQDCNLDYFNDLASVSGKICNPDGYPVAYESYSIGQLTGVTDEYGNFNAFVPANRQLTLSHNYGSMQIQPLPPRRIFNVASAMCNNAAALSGKFYFSHRLGQPFNSPTHVDVFNDVSQGSQDPRVSFNYHQASNVMRVVFNSTTSPFTLRMRLNGLTANTRSLTFGGVADTNLTHAVFIADGKEYSTAPITTGRSPLPIWGVTWRSSIYVHELTRTNNIPSRVEGSYALIGYHWTGIRWESREVRGRFYGKVN